MIGPDTWHVGKAEYDRIMAEVIQAAELGQTPDPREFATRYPGHETTVRNVLEAFGIFSRPLEDAPSPSFHVLLSPGIRLGDFEIIEPLAHGGMGEVYRARQLTLGGRVVAVKVLPGDTANERTVARFEREARTLAKLHHPNLAEVYGFGEERGTFFYAMRLIPGPTLREVLHHRSAARRTGHADPPDQRRALVERMVEVADALAVVHAAGAVHRDIKPANIVFEGGTSVRALDHAAILVDFGLVRFADTSTLTQTGDSTGTPSYAPPEQLLGQEVDARADVFSLGVTLHDLLARRGPHERAQASSGLEPLHALDPTIDADLCAVVAKAADPEPRWRYPDAATLRDDLVAWLKGHGVTARRMPWTERARRWAIRHPRRVTQGALAAVVLLVAIAGIAGVGRVSGSISSAGEMLRRWDLPALDRELAGIPLWVPLDLVAEKDLAEAARRLRARDPADPFFRIHGALLDNKLEDALNTATTAVETAGFGADPLVTDFLIHEFKARRTAPGSHERPWAVFAARLFYEKPVFDPADIARVEPYRQALCAIWQRDDLDPTERKYLLTAASGCAHPDELPIFLRWSLEEGRTPEERRIVMRLTDQVIRRAWKCGQLGDLDLELVWDVILRTWSDWSERKPDELPWGTSIALSRAARTTVLANRTLGRGGISTTAALPTDWTRMLEEPELREPLETWIDCLAAGGTPELVAALKAEALPALVLDLRDRDPVRLGRLCSLLPVEHQDSAAARCSDGRIGRFLNDFAEGREYGDRLSRGDEPELLLDEDTHLVRADSTSAVPVQLCETSATDAIPTPCPDALWQFENGCVTRSGKAAGTVCTEAVTLFEDGEGWYARLAAFGKSALHLEFDVPADSLGIDRVVSLGVQTNVRDLYPQMGTARILVELGGAEVASISFGTPSEIEQSFRIPAHALRPGRNALGLRLLASSTTPLRVHRISVGSLPK